MMQELADGDGYARPMISLAPFNHLPTEYRRRATGPHPLAPSRDVEGIVAVER